MDDEESCQPTDPGMSLRVLVLGCGYIGLPLGAALARQGHTVFGVRRSPSAAPELAAAGLQPLCADLTDPDDLRRLPGPFDWVVNTVAAPVGSGVDGYRATYQEGTANLLAWLRHSPPRAYVYTSSTGVYGQDDGGWVDESSPTQPESSTARLLVETEQLLLGATQDWEFPGMILRVAGIYGPGRGYWLRQLLQGEARIPGDGQRWMNMAHRDDIVQAIQAALERGRPGQVCNVCDDEPVTHLAFFEWLTGQLGRPLPPFAPEEPASRRKRGLTNKRIANRRLREEFGVRLTFPTYREGYGAELRRLGLGGVSSMSS
jgi:nucleoside-diphosphate-sugar epimerase